MTTYRPLSQLEIRSLESKGCRAGDWACVTVADGFDARYVVDVAFSGSVRLGRFDKIIEIPGFLPVHSGISKARLHDCTIGNNVYISRINNFISNYEIGDDAYIENCDLMATEPLSSFGNGVRVAVLNEGGGREVPIFDALNSHLAYLLTLYRHETAAIAALERQIEGYVKSVTSDYGRIGCGVRIQNCGTIRNLRIGDYAIIEGVSQLANGSILSSRQAPTKVGHTVIANDFIVAKGSCVADAAQLERCFVGQSCILSKQFSAIDSLFFANCEMLHGEAVSLFAGPYSASHHKSTLLIAGMFSFMNSGSGSNQSNHLYKLGPVHQGVAERGVKLASDSYLAWPAHIGAFTSVIGRHTAHPDVAELPFSYLIADGAVSYLKPGLNIRTVGTARDAAKWPARDNRGDDRAEQLTFDLWNPYIVEKIIAAEQLLLHLKEKSPNADFYTHGNCRIASKDLERGIELYHLAVVRYFGMALKMQLTALPAIDKQQLIKDFPFENELIARWIDFGGLVTPKIKIDALLRKIAADEVTLEQINSRFAQLNADYAALALSWSRHQMCAYYGFDTEGLTVAYCLQVLRAGDVAARKLHELLLDDAAKEFGAQAQIGFGVDSESATADFRAVRGTFEENGFIVQLSHQAEEDSTSIAQLIKRLEAL